MVESKGWYTKVKSKKGINGTWKQWERGRNRVEMKERIDGEGWRKKDKYIVEEKMAWMRSGGRKESGSG